ncbi:MAG TPA: DNA replication/repair protein RecF [Candidatus Dormibacteraeota bacterium]
MHLVSLQLRNYRNYSRLDIEPGNRLNVFLGANGQGKTNLLESVALLALSTSPRARRDSELVGPLAPEARVTALVQSGERSAEIRISIRVEGERARRRIEVDGQPRRAVDLPGLFRVTLFWPDDLNLIKAGPEHRRRLLNEMLVQVRPGYARGLSRYARVLEQRNSLLKQVGAGEQPPSALEVWDLELARLGGELVEARRQAVADLAVTAAAGHAAISGGEVLDLRYVGPPDDLLAALQRTRAEDVRRGSTGAGPHRDDIHIRLAERDARAFASQGQQRTAVVSIKLAEAAVVAQMTGERPVLLLDDVLSELDASRRGSLLEQLGDPGQVIITSVEADPFPERVISSSVVRCIQGGMVKSCGQTG